VLGEELAERNLGVRSEWPTAPATSATSPTTSATSPAAQASCEHEPDEVRDWEWR